VVHREKPQRFYPDIGYAFLERSSPLVGRHAPSPTKQSASNLFLDPVSSFADFRSFCFQIEGKWDKEIPFHRARYRVKRKFEILVVSYNNAVSDQVLNERGLKFSHFLE